jgi:hypothetical protein
VASTVWYLQGCIVMFAEIAMRKALKARRWTDTASQGATVAALPSRGIDTRTLHDETDPGSVGS